MFKSPTWTAGGGSRREDNEVDCISFSDEARLLVEFFQGIDEMDEDMRLNILLVLLDFLLLCDSFFSFFSDLLSSPSWLCTDLDSLILRPKFFQVLSEDVRDAAILCSRECEERTSRGEVGSVLPRGGLMGVKVAT